MPGEFGMYFFDGGVANGSSGLPVEDEVRKLTKWVCIKNGLYSALEMLAVKYPFAAGVGRKTANVGPGGNANTLAVDASAKGLMRALRQLPTLVTDKVYNPNAPPAASLLAPYVQTWDQVRTNDAAFRGFGGQEDEDQAIYGDMAPEGRLELVLSLIENTYATELRLIQGRFPLINLFDIYLEQAARGAAGASIASMANGR